MSQEDSLQLTEEANKEVSLGISPWGLLSHGNKPYLYASSVNLLETNTGIEGHCSEVCR